MSINLVEISDYLQYPLPDYKVNMSKYVSEIFKKYNVWLNYVILTAYKKTLN